MIDIRDYIPEDSLTIDTHFKDDSKEFSWTITEDEVPLAILGVYCLHHGCYRAFTCFNKKKKISPLFITKIAKLLLQQGPRLDPCMGRIEATVRRDFPIAIRWATLLGFEYEGILHNFDEDDGSDHLMFYFKGLKRENNVG
ncbi:MAG TPA: hypothetical protein EYO59_00020 [Chromatiaceae bacterium]|nr:hypothetical protein [Chromatiaceae bacterium]HIO46585.1 hypothetical protein [Candidatus Poribacteria bacterium]